MCIASYPWIVRRAAWNARKPCLAFTRRLIARWSCSRMLFKYRIGRWRQRAPQDSFLLHSCNRRPVEACLVGVDDAGLRMRRNSQRLTEQAFGRRGIAQAREHEVDRGAGGIDGSVEVAPTALDTNVG